MEATRLADSFQQPDLGWFFFRSTGRVNRTAFLLGGLLIAVFQSLPLYRMTLVPPDSQAYQTWASVFVLLFFVSLWSNVVLGIKRLHDMDKPGIAAISLFVPIVSILAFVVLCIFPGTSGPNSYGSRTNAPR